MGDIFKVLIQKISKDGAYSIFLTLGILFILGTLFIQYSHNNDELEAKIAADKDLLSTIKEISNRVDHVKIDVKEIGAVLGIEDSDCLNKLDRQYTHDEMCVVLQNTKYKIIYDVMLIITNNNIQNKERQKIIKDKISINILGYFKTDKEYLQRVSYKGVSLNKVWDTLDPDIVITLIFNTLFSPYYADKHELLRKDLYEIIDNTFDVYHQKTILELDILTKGKK